MGKKIILVITLFVCLHSTSQAQVYIDNMYKQANAMARAAVKGEYATLLQYTHPTVVKSMGGRDKALITLKQGLEAIKSSSFAIKKVAIGKMTQSIVSKENIQCIVPQIMDIEVSGVNAHSNNYLFGISYDGGKNWYFMDTAAATPEKLKQLFPEINKNLVIPKSQTTYK
ncbi:hypothetical protein [Pedobacter sp. Hv1]|uniref:hypothetical protein n=1 Tax=Pedobacter sp. Hv1 TaxID=1740090 RepID=UPI00128F87D2|nr:hypothetical protein [Pedobacter sp. Hv1]